MFFEQRRRKTSKQQQQIFMRKQRGMIMYTVDVDLKENLCGQKLSLWLTCLRGYSHDINFNKDNNYLYKTSMLLNIKKRVDNTFEYEDRIRRVTKGTFHTMLK